MTGAIICNGSVSDYSLFEKRVRNAQLIVCADGGAKHLRKCGIIPHILLGDFDSISQVDLNFYKENGVEIITFPAQKDMTDTEIALDTAVEKGCHSLVILGGVGTRLDHSMANIFLLKKLLDLGIRATVADEYNEITVIKDYIELHREGNEKVTLLPLTERVEGVTTKGLYYQLDNAAIDMGSSWGVSNEFVDDVAEVVVKKGILLVIKARD